VFSRIRSSQARSRRLWTWSLGLVGCVAFAAGCSCDGKPGGAAADLLEPAAIDLAPAADLSGVPSVDLSGPITNMDGGDGGSVHATTRLGGNAPVAGGDRSRSPHYLLIHTLGQPTQNQQKTVSPGYRLQGGLSGATGR
jgi:hypothetical protein